MTAETSNARGEWPERYACNGPEGTFWTDDAALANKLIGAAFDRDEWTVTDTQNPTGATPPLPADAEVWMFKGTDGAWHTFLNEQHRLDTIADGRWEVRKFTAISQQPEAQGGGEVAAWETEDGRVISARQKATALRDGGASASSVAPYTTPLYRTAPPSAPVGVEDVVMAARNAENAIRNCAAAGQIGDGYVQYADALRDAVQRLAQQPAAVDEARSGSSIMDGAVSFVEALAAQHQEPKS